ncbi:MAG TPA: DUF4058 family protein [Pirellulales bacterium]|nr:DUF4058 family protein [Pirellulales bacterium]
MSAVLNTTLPPPYYARLQMRPEIGVVDGDTGTAYRHRVVPDVAVAEVRRPQAGRGGSTATAALPRTEVSDYLEITVPDEPGRHLSIEVRDPRRRHRLVTFIEIVSPANKIIGADRESYLEKHEEVFASDASLMEIDLLRGGRRLLPNPRVRRKVSKLKPPPDYLVLVSRAWTRGEGRGTWQVFPVLLRRMLPVVAVPLRVNEPEIPLDLRHVCNRAYDAGRTSAGPSTMNCRLIRRSPRPITPGRGSGYPSKRSKRNGQLSVK